MIKDIIVNLTPGAESDPAGRYAISVAEAFDAHVTGVAFAYDPSWPPAVTDMGGAELLRSLLEKTRTNARTAAEQFQAAAKRSQLSVQTLHPETSLADATASFASLARGYDLVVVKQSQPDDDIVAKEMIQAALFNSGRPVLIVPYIQKSGFSIKRVLVCWDGSRSAARAVGDSLARAFGLFGALEDVYSVANNRILALPGVRHVETAVAVRTLKYDYRAAKITLPKKAKVKAG